MGYDVHITKANEWVDSEEAPITLDAWKAYIASDPEMRYDEDVRRNEFSQFEGDNGETVRFALSEDQTEGMAIWSSPKDGEFWFHYHKGRVSVKNPTDQVLQKMKLIAIKLDAQVQGDEDEIYFERPSSKKSFFKKLLGK